MKFVVDSMLARLGRWLRILGYDTLIMRNESDSEILAVARKEKRVLLTRDKKLAEVGGILVPEKLEDQLLFLKKRGFIQLVPRAERCSLCNARIKEVCAGIWACRCGQVYWEGAHWKRILEFLRRLDPGCSFNGEGAD